MVTLLLLFILLENVCEAKVQVLFGVGIYVF